MTTIPKQDAPLYIDVICYKCKRRVALSNAHERNGRYYCGRCLSPMIENIIKAIKLVVEVRGE